MKNRSGLLMAILLILSGFSSCSKPDIALPEKIPTTVSVIFANREDPDDAETHTDDAETHTLVVETHTVVSDYFNPSIDYDSVTDIDGNIYKTVRIGSQTWMAENLKTTLYNDGTKIPHVTDDSRWVTLETGAYRWYMNDENQYKGLYGALYNWYTVKGGKLCPVGWHVPGDEEWKKLEMELGMTQSETDAFAVASGRHLRLHPRYDR
jgi:hypothetical protein